MHGLDSWMIDVFFQFLSNCHAFLLLKKIQHGFFLEIWGSKNVTQPAPSLRSAGIRNPYSKLCGSHAIGFAEAALFHPMICPTIIISRDWRTYLESRSAKQGDNQNGLRRMYMDVSTYVHGFAQNIWKNVKNLPTYRESPQKRMINPYLHCTD